MKEYVFIHCCVLLFFTKLSKDTRKKFGKREETDNNIAGMFLLWFSVGIWHGGDWKYIIGSGLLHWFYIVSGELLEPWYLKCMEKLHINP